MDENRDNNPPADQPEDVNPNPEPQESYNPPPPPPGGPGPVPPAGEAKQESKSYKDQIKEGLSTQQAVVETAKDAQQWAMICHLSALVGYLGIPFGHILGPLVVWLIKKGDMPYVDSQGKEALNFHISMSLYALLVSPLICLAGLGFVLLAIIGIADIVFLIIAAVAASGGKDYRYPLTLRLVK